MSKAIRVVSESSVAEESVEKAKELSRKIIAASKEKDRDLLSYEFYFSDDGEILHTLEWFASSEALLQHLGNIGAIMAELAKVTELKRIDVFGDASPELVEALRPFGPRFVRSWDGFTR